MSVTSRLLLIVVVAGLAACELLVPSSAPDPVTVDLPAPLLAAGLDIDVMLFNPQIPSSPYGGTIHYVERSVPAISRIGKS